MEQPELEEYSAGHLPYERMSQHIFATSLAKTGVRNWSRTFTQVRIDISVEEKSSIVQRSTATPLSMQRPRTSSKKKGPTASACGDVELCR